VRIPAMLPLFGLLVMALSPGCQKASGVGGVGEPATLGFVGDGGTHSAKPGDTLTLRAQVRNAGNEGLNQVPVYFARSDPDRLKFEGRKADEDVVRVLTDRIEVDGIWSDGIAQAPVVVLAGAIPGDARVWAWAVRRETEEPSADVGDQPATGPFDSYAIVVVAPTENPSDAVSQDLGAVDVPASGEESPSADVPGTEAGGDTGGTND